MSFTKVFKDISKHDAAIAGGKGASLGEMTQAGIPVPGGFVILSGAFDDFIRETHLEAEIEAELEKVNIEEVHTAENASEVIRALIIKSEMPKGIASEVLSEFKKLDSRFVAVRSSATSEDSASAAWAGQLDSFLNTKEDMLLENVKKCWASLFTPRAIFYRFEKNMQKDKVSVAVVVQKMVESEISGISFSVHPVTQDRNQIIIEAGYGLGEAIVSGQITPDSYVIEKKEWRIIEKNINTQSRGLYKIEAGGNEWRDISEEEGEKQKLSDEQVVELSKLVFRIENHYGFPVDVEWAREKDKFCIVQSRPITTLTKESSEEDVKKKNDLDKEKLVLYLSRPHTLFTASLWQRWYESSEMKDIVGVFMPDAMLEESPRGQINYYVDGGQFDAFKERFKDLLKNNRDYCLDALKIAEDYNKKAELYLSGKKKFKDIQEAVDFLTKLAIYGALFPYFLPLANEQLDKDPKINKLSEELRSVSFYPKVLLDVVVPFARRYLVSLGGAEDLDLITIQELIDGDVSEIIKRKSERSKNKLFNYEVFNGKKVVSWRDENKNLLETNEVSGMSAYGGKAKGRARLVFSFDGKGVDFNEGEVLVASHTSPNLMNIMKKAVAVITDEGGVTSHAAIISRELKKPCIIGTKNATKIIKDGDLVEVDADKGVVKIIERFHNDPTFIEGSQWKLAVTRNMSLFHDVLNHLGGERNCKDFGINAPYRGLFVVVDGIHTSAFIEPKSYSEYLQAIMDAFSTKEKTEEIKRKYEKYAQEVMQSLQRANKKLNVNTWTNFLNAYQKFTAGLTITTHMGRVGTEKLVQLLRDYGIKEDEITNVLSSITYPSEHTPLFKSQLKLLEIGADLQNGKIRREEKKLKIWLDEFGAIPVNFCDEPWNIEDAKKQLSTIMQKDCKSELSKLSIQHNNRIKEKTLLLKKIKNKEINILAFALAEVTCINEFRKNIFCKLSLGYRGIFNKIAVLCGSNNWRDCFFLFPDETVRVISGEKIDLLNLVKNRRLSGAYINSAGALTILEESKLEELERYIKSTHSNTSDVFEDNRIIKGFSASRGKVVALARIILSSKDFNKLNSGEILVSTMTSVDFVPVMQKAAAFVTNEGGITSHAAIVAREMNKPCIIGTKNATKIIKDGDLVEVDADKGTVRIMERN